MKGEASTLMACTASGWLRRLPIPTLAATCLAALLASLPERAETNQCTRQGEGL